MNCKLLQQALYKASNVCTSGMLHDSTELDDPFAHRVQHDLLTPREREVLQLIAEGKSNKEAAAALFVSATTIETHRARIMDKLDLHSTADIVLYAVRKGIVQLR